MYKLRNIKEVNTIMNDIVKIKNREGLHAFLLTLFIMLATRFKCSIWIEKVNLSKRVSAKSLLGILSLNLCRGDVAKIVADGPNEDLAVQTLKLFIEYGCAKEKYDELDRKLSNFL